MPWKTVEYQKINPILSLNSTESSAENVLRIVTAIREVGYGTATRHC